MKKIALKISLGLLALLAASCVTELIPDPSPTRLGINVLDDNKEKVYGVSVYLFDNEIDFNDAKKTGNVSKRIKEGITEQLGDSVSLVFTNLNYNSDYYVFVSYRDRKRFVDLDNFSTSYLVTQKILYQETTTTVNVNLSQAKSSISFYSNNAPASQFPIKIFLANDSIGKLTENTTGLPNPSSTQGVLNYKISSGDTWFAKSAGGCFWAGSIEVDGTESFLPIKLEDCDAGAITFWVKDVNASLLPIQLTLNGLDDIGSLQKSGEALECFSEKGLSVGRKAGTYTYTAKSLSKSCNWTGTIDLGVGNCQMIELKPCN